MIDKEVIHDGSLIYIEGWNTRLIQSLSKHLLLENDISGNKNLIEDESRIIGWDLFFGYYLPHPHTRGSNYILSNPF